ncbi:hypothetical protein OTU49_010294, partial [Cherax quadricarinatus]
VSIHNLQYTYSSSTKAHGNSVNHSFLNFRDISRMALSLVDLKGGVGLAGGLMVSLRAGGSSSSPLAFRRWRELLYLGRDAMRDRHQRPHQRFSNIHRPSPSPSPYGRLQLLFLPFLTLSQNL